jgi:hypothetical protein
MSNTQYAFLKNDAIPDRATLQSWIDGLGFDLKLDLELDLVKDRGFSPCTLLGMSDVGFELWPEPTADVAAGSDELLAIAGDRGFCVAMSWGGSLKDCAAVMIVSCALAKHCDAAISYEGNEPESLSQMLRSTQEVVEDARSDA